MPFPAPFKHCMTLTPLFAAIDPVGSLDHSFPIHPDDKHPGSDEFKQKNKRKPRPEPHPEEGEGKHQDPDYQIDEYA